MGIPSQKLHVIFFLCLKVWYSCALIKRASRLNQALLKKEIGVECVEYKTVDFRRPP
jgi:hypothetical protein